MCNNHSHLIARFLGEDTSGEVPVLIYQLANQAVAIQSPRKDGGTLTLPTTGLLYLPSWTLDGWSRTHGQATEAPSTSLFFMPDDALTSMQSPRRASSSFGLTYETLSGVEVPFPMPEDEDAAAAAGR